MDSSFSDFVNDCPDEVRRIYVLLDADMEIPRDVRLWLKQGFGDYMRKQGDLESCLGLRARRGRSNERLPAIAWQDLQERIFQRIGDTLPGTPYAKADILSNWMQWVTGKRTRDYNGTQPDFWQMNLLYDLHTKAMREGLRLPTSQPQIYRILNGRRD